MSRLQLKYIFIFPFLLLLSCQEDIKKKEAYKKGSITLAIDPSFLNLATALVEVFQSSYPEAKITFKTEVEDMVIVDLLNGKVPIAMTGRDLTTDEAEILYTRTKIKYIPTQIACDATIFIVSKESLIEEIVFPIKKSEIISEDSKFVFDGGNSSNFNNVKEKLELKIDKGQKIKSLNNALEVVDFISRNTWHIGIIGFNVVSDEDDPKIKQLLSKVKILPVKINDNKVYPTVPNMRDGIYPFTKRVFLLNAENSFKIGSSFSRFCGSQRGQLIVSRAGLQPYYLYERRVEIH